MCYFIMVARWHHIGLHLHGELVYKPIALEIKDIVVKVQYCIMNERYLFLITSTYLSH